MKGFDKRNIQDIFALTPLQEGMLFHYLKNPGSDLYIEQVCLGITGEIDFQHFKNAWNFVCHTNEMLRAVFRWEKIQDPIQIILKNHEANILYLDFSNKKNWEKEIQLAALKLNHGGGKFDLQDVPFRVILCKMDNNRFEMIISYHHILYDGWSNGIILKEFFRAYYDLLKVKQLEIPAKTKFKEFIKWFQGRDNDKEKKYWGEYLKDLNMLPGLSIKQRKRPSHKVDPVVPGKHYTRLETDVFNRLKTFVKLHKITLASFLYTSWGLLLQVYNDCEDVIFGTTISGRSAGVQGIEDIVGLFINTIPLRLQWFPYEKTRDLLNRVDKTLRDREAFEATPLVNIKQYSKVDAQVELFDSIVVIENYPLDTKIINQYKGLRVESYSVKEMTHYDLTVGIIINDDLEVSFLYDKTSLAEDAVIRLSNHFTGIVKTMLTHPELETANIEIVQDHEKRQILYEFNQPLREESGHKTLHEWFTGQAENTPDHRALVCSRGSHEKDHNASYSSYGSYTSSITYKVLNEKSNQLGHLLMEKGIYVDTVVGIMVDRSIEMIIGLLGILKAGSAYLPIDPDYPEERFQYMLNDSSAKILLKDNDFRPEAFNNHPKGTSPHLRLSPAPTASLAYIIYTSGSTGKPKGTAVKHSNVIAYVQAFLQEFSVNAKDIVLQQSSCSFDAFVEEVYPVLFKGGSLAIPGKHEIPDIRMLSRFIARFQVNIISCSPLLLDELNRYDPLRLTSVHTFISGGDVLRGGYINNLLKIASVYNTYGPTEAAVCAAYYRCPAADNDLGSNIPIGSPIENYNILILDRNNKLLPVQIPGELNIIGPGVVRGYLNLPELTSEKFIKMKLIKSFCGVQGRFFQKEPLAAGGKSNLRLYKTGDLARWLPDGNIEFLGRIDCQVKIRGFRIEPGEIECLLMAHKDISAAVVIARDDSNHDKHLAAYVVLAGQRDQWANKVEEWREYLSAKLPAYMIPAFFVEMERLPMTVSGKPDRQKLPASDRNAFLKDSSADYICPGDIIEEQLVRIWAEVLGIDKSIIGVDSNFFRLGGHSLRATRLGARIHKDLHINIPLKELFNSPTVRGMGEYIRFRGAPGRYPALKAVAGQEYYDLSYAQRRLWIICQFQEDSIAYNQVGRLSITGKFNSPAFEQALQALVDRHQSLRTIFTTINGEPKQKILEKITVSLEQVDWRGFSPLERDEKNLQMVKDRANKPFNLETGPLFLFQLSRTGDEEYFLLAITHHIINDGWSIDIMRRELCSLYNFFNGLPQGGKNREIPLPVVKFQYKDYSLWHNRLIAEGFLDQFKAYWEEKFKDKPTGVELPLDHSRPSVQTFNGGRVYYRLDPGVFSLLKDLCPGEDATMFMKCLALVTILLYKYSGECDVIVGVPIANRVRPELHHIVGFLVNTLVYRVRVNPGESFFQLLKKVRLETLQCFENQDYPFDLLVENLGLDRDMSRSPLFNVMVVFETAEMQGVDWSMEGVKVSFYNQVEGFNPSVFDLVFFFNENGPGRCIDCEIMYNCDLFERGTIEGMADNFLTLVSHVLSVPGKPVEKLEYIHAREYEKIIFHFNDFREDFPGLTVRELVEQQVQRTPDQVAVVSPSGGEFITYKELNRCANRLAHYLRGEIAIKPGDIVGICIERSIAMITAILGVIKSGAGYLSIDPGYPEDRVEHMVKDSRVQVILIDRVRPHLPLGDGSRGIVTIDIYVEWDRIGQCPTMNPGVFNEPGDIVYVIYTSGSTGMPNGAMLSQVMLANLVQWQIKNTSIDASGRCLQFTSINFCVSFQEIMITLSGGGEVHLIDEIERQDVRFLVDFLVRHRVENLYLPFSYLNFLFHEFAGVVGDRGGEKLCHLKHIITAGEQLKITAGLKNFLDRHPHIKLHNHYGSSEMHVVTSYTLDASSAALMPVPPAGKPIANTRIYILDEAYNPVPIGVWGEVCVDGCAQVPGYIHNQVLTDKKLLFHPVLSSITNHRLYCSGDIGRWTASGNIELKGRKDFQLKIRGFRVEPDEIESRLLMLDRIKDCVVVVKEKPGGEKILVAYIVAGYITREEIKNHIRTYLPQYMIPKFVLLESLPLMPNGKVNRERLPDLPSEEAQLLEIDPGEITALVRQKQYWEPGDSGLAGILALFTRDIEEYVLHYHIGVSAVDTKIFSRDSSQSLTGIKFAAVHQLFEDQAAMDPDRIAILGMQTHNQKLLRGVKGGGFLEKSPPYYINYQQLNESANRLAYLLKERGVVRGSIVGLLFSNSIDMVIGVLAVLKAGAGYLVLSPRLPVETVIDRIDQANALLVLTGSDEIDGGWLLLLRARGSSTVRPLVTIEQQQISNFDRVPIPDRSLVNYDRYSRDIGLAMVKNTVTIQATRGCPYGCLYCHKIWPRRHVVRSAENIFHEVELYYNMGMRRFVFVDDIFNLDMANSARFFKLVIKNRLEVNFFFPNGLRCDLLTREYIDLMVEAGTVSLGFALESASPRIQELIKKNLDLGKLRENIEYIFKHHPQVILELFLMHGFPTETEEEALMTLDFLKSLEWVDFPYLHILKIYPNTDMAEMAMENEVSADAITRSVGLAFHELPDTLPFDRSFTLKFQADFLNDYFLLKERLLARLPFQMRVLTPEEIVAKYNSYLPIKIETMGQLLEFVGISPGELGIRLDKAGDVVPGDTRPVFGMPVPGLHAKMRAHFPGHRGEKQALRILLLDLSQFFSREREMLYDGVEPPLGLMYLLTYLYKELGSRVQGKIAKSRIDFDNFDELKTMLVEFRPQVIGIRTLSYYAGFFHKTVALIRHWGFDVPIIVGGPYATSDYTAILQDPHVDLAVLSEGELTFTQVVGEILKNQGKLPTEKALREIPGIAFIPSAGRDTRVSSREVLLLDGLEDVLAGMKADNPEPMNHPGKIANILFRDRGKGFEKLELTHGMARSLCTGEGQGKLAAAILFDGAVYQLFPALAGGGMLCIPHIPGQDYEQHIEGIELLEFYKDLQGHSLAGPPVNIRLRLAENHPWTREEPFENDDEEKLADIWAELLGIEKRNIKGDDNFFEKGGHSLKATVLASRIHKVFNVDIALRDIFTTPTIRDMAAMIKESKKDQFVSIESLEKRDFYELSSAQQRLYVVQQMDETGISYNLPSMWILQGLVDRARLELTFWQMITRHESFRTSFTPAAGRPVQRVHDKVEFEIEYYDMQVTGALIHGDRCRWKGAPFEHELNASGEDLATEDTESTEKKNDKLQITNKKERSSSAQYHYPKSQERRTMSFINSFIRPFDLTRAPLVRVGLLHVPGVPGTGFPSQEKDTRDKYILMLDIHHIISDGRSAEILIREFTGFYEGREFPGLKLRYKDYSCWLERIKDAGALLSQQEYWLKEFGAEKGIPVLNLPTDYIRPAVQAFEGRDMNFSLGIEETSALKALGLAQGATLFMVVTTVINVFLSKLTVQEDIVVGTPVAGRRHADLEPIIGMFVNTLALRNFPRGEKSFRDFLTEVKENALMAFENQEYQYEDLVDQVNVKRDASRNPLFDAAFALQGADYDHINQWEFPGLKIKNLEFETCISRFDLTFFASESAGELLFRVEYSTRLFKSTTIERFINYFKNLVTVISADPGNKLSRLEILPAREKHQIVYDFNRTGAAYSKDKTLHELFEKQAEQTPDYAALLGDATPGANVKAGDKVLLTYRELNQVSNRLARVLREKSLDRAGNRLTAVLMDRSPEMIIGVMAILKAGGAYVPLEPYLPGTRLGFIMSSLEPRYVLTQKVHFQRLGNLFQRLPGLEHIVCVEEEIASARGVDEDNLPSLTRTGDMAYVIFTSGSTGTPKGVVLQHRPVINTIQWVNKTFAVEAPDKLLYIVSLGFDLSVYDIFGILASGGSIRVAANNDLKNPEDLLEMIYREGITFWDSAPAALQQLVPFFPGSSKSKNIGCLRKIFLSGDWVPVTLPDILKVTFPGVRIIVLGGATEAAVWSNYYLVDKSAADRVSIPYGKPIQNAAYYILDTYGKVCPIGVPGNLYIGWQCLAAGYINEPGLTAKKFVYNPFIPGRMYNTGDMARWFDDGNMEFLGRSDYQVKIRGHRIELGEIECQLLDDEEVKEAVVMAVKPPGAAAVDKQLAAYVVPGSIPGTKEQSDRLTGNLKNYLKERLPDYMIPQAFVFLDQLPLSPNGKIDRKALPEAIIEPGVGYQAPRDHIEEKLVEIWTEVLAKPLKIGINDNFFQLGGHSLNASVLMSNIQQAFNVKAPLAEIFRIPTIRELALYIHSAAREKYVSIKPVEKKEYYRLSSAQKRLYFINRLDPGNIGYNMPAVMILEGDVDRQKLEKTFKQLITMQESLRTCFRMIDNEPVQEIHDQVEFEIEHYNLQLTGALIHENRCRCEDEETRGTAPLQTEPATTLISSFIRPFDLSAAPLLRVGLVPVEQGNHILMVDMHHIAADGISVGLLLDDFITLLNHEKPIGSGITYKDYAYWQFKQMETTDIKKQEAYWLGEFAEEIPMLNLPVDFPRPAVQSLEGNALSFEISPAQTGQLKQMFFDRSCSLFMGLLCLFNVLLSRLSKQEDIVVGCASAGRSLPELQRVIGMFVNTLALRNYPAAEKPFSQFLREVKTRTLRAFDNQEYQFEELVEKLPVKRDMGRNPLFDAAIDLQDESINNSIRADNPGAVKMKPYPYSLCISKFDLVFHCEESGDKLLFTVDYCVKLFKENTIQRFSQYFRKIISQVIDHKDIKIAEIDILSALEKQEILKNLNRHIDSPRVYLDGVLHRLFEKQVEKNPGRISLIEKVQITKNKLQNTNYKQSSALRADANASGEVQLSYKELNNKSNQLAHFLRKRGVKHGDIVGILMEPGIEMLTAIFAVLKAGGVYLPIDPAYPGNRVQFMLDDGDAKFLLTTTGAVENFSFTEMQGLQIKENEHIKRSGIQITLRRSQITDLDAQPLVDRTTVNYDQYSRYIGIAMVKQTISLQATRGCPYKCAYCHKIWPKTHVFRSAEHIFAEVRQYYNLGVRRFVFIDDVFNLNRENSRRFFQFIIDNNLEVQLFFPNGVRGDILTRDYIDLMIQAGTISLALALETASPRLQKLVRKNLDVEKLRENLEYLCKQYPNVILELFTMHGFPGESEKEALQTLDFIKNLHWLHFPYVNILKIYPSTDMAEIARTSGISSGAIARSTNLAYHELPETLPFDKQFTTSYQADFFNRYFLLKERLLHVLPYQIKILTEDELVQKYNSYLPVEIKSFTDFLEFAGITGEELELTSLCQENPFYVPDLDRRIKQAFTSPVRPREEALKVLLLDLSLFFSKDTEAMLYNLVEPPLGLMVLLTSLKQQLGDQINGKIAKSCIDFDSYEELKQLLEEFQPDLIGLRTLSLYKHFFHRTAAMIRHWGIEVPIIAGGPYATSDYTSLLKDRNINLVVLGEGELTFCHIVSESLKNNGKLPDETVLEQIPGIAYKPLKNGALPANTREIIMLDALKPRANQPTGNLPGTDQPRSPAYVIYTSGTTGKPKGVMVEHRNISSLMKTGQDMLSYHHNDIWTMFHSFCFDFSVWEMYGALLHGGKLVLIPRMTTHDPQKYLEILKQKMVTILNQTPTVFYQLVEEEIQCTGNDLHLRYVIFGGEALKPGKLKAWKEKYPDTKLINMYGITETTVHATFKEISHEEINLNTSNIGKFLPSLFGYIMNNNFKLQPQMVPGELLVAGQGVSRGYLNRPELTAEKFHRDLWDYQDDHDKKQKARSKNNYRSYRSHRSHIYQSGDLVKLMDNGEMEYLGRIDHQVKIRGNRVETGEIERQLMLVPGIEAALVIPRKDEHGNNYLCAYMKLGQGKYLTIPELREVLLKKLPDYMVPSYFIPLETFPVTASGKLDRAKLPEPDAIRTRLGAAYAAPVTETEKIVASAWQEVLKLDKVGIHDNFFDLGGTSLDIVRLNSGLKKVLSREIPVVILFEYPTIHSFTQHMEPDQPITAVPAEEKTPDFSAKIKKGRDKMKSRRQRVK